MRPLKFYCRTRPPNEFAWKFAVSLYRVVRINRVTYNEQRRWIQRRNWIFFKEDQFAASIIRRDNFVLLLFLFKIKNF